MEIKNIPDTMSLPTKAVEWHWERLKGKYPERAARMKRAFFVKMALHIYNFLLDHHLKGDIGIPSIDEVTSLLFHFHYFYSGHLPDGERAEHQRSDKYKEELSTRVANHIFMRMQSLSLKAGGNEYSPEIVCTEGYIDALTRVALSATPVTTDEKNTQERFATIRPLIIMALSLAKSILYQMSSSLPSHALISWRSLLELEYKVLVLSMYDSTLTKRFTEFGKYEMLDEDKDADSPLMANYRERARLDGYDVRHQGYKNYGWLLSIEMQDGWKPYPSLKFLLTVVGDTERYEKFRTASTFTHHSAATLHKHEGAIYDFLVSEMSRSLQNLQEAIDNLKEQYGITTEEHDRAVSLYACYHADAVSQYFVNRLSDGDE